MNEDELPILQTHPKHIFPVLWMLREVLGLSAQQVKNRCGVSFSMQRRLYDGYSPTKSTQRKLRSLLLEAQNQIERRPSPTELPLKQFRQALITLAEYLRSATKDPSRDPLFDSLRSSIPTYPKLIRRAHIVKQLSSHYTKEQIIGKARRMGVVESTNNQRQTMWTLPPHGAPNMPQRPPFQYKKPRGEKKQRLHNKLQAFLMRGPDGKRTVKEIIAKFCPEYPRTYLFHSFHELNLGRETEGFGPNKVTRWFQQFERQQLDPDAICTECASHNLIKFPNGEFLCKDCSHTFTLTITSTTEDKVDAE